jgi:hypothetical protein
MRRMARAERLLVWLAMVALCGCMPKVNDALKNAESAIAEAEAASASQKYPELLQAANDHLKEGKRQRYMFRSNLATFEFQAAEESARLAAQYAKNGAPAEAPKCPACIQRTCPPSPECPVVTCPEAKPCPPCPAGTTCAPCPERTCPREEKRVKTESGPAAQCPTRHCPACNCESPHCPACPRESAATKPDKEKPAKPEKTPVAAAGGPLLGTITYTPPAMLIKGKTDYEVVVKYQPSQLDAGAAKTADNYRLLLDVVKVEPAEVTVSSPMNDYEPLTAHNGEWKLPLTAPAELTGPVTITIQAIVSNTATNKEQKLAPAVLTIPAAACPEAKPCPEAKAAPLTPAPAPKSGWLGRLLMLVIGLGVGAGGGYGAARVLAAKGPTFKAGE